MLSFNLRRVTVCLLAAALFGPATPAIAGDTSVGSRPIELGRRIFEHNFGLPASWKGEPLGDRGDGLGPVFNDFSCVSCHRQGGTGGAGPREKNALVLSLILPDGANATQAEAVTREASQTHSGLSAMQLSTPLHRFGLPTGSGAKNYEEFLAELFDQLSYDPSQSKPLRGRIGNATYEIAQRNTAALWGVGLIDEFRRRDGNSVRRRIIEENNRRFPWLSGRAPRDVRQQDSWWGWRGQMATLHEFNLAACATEQGLSVPGMPQHHSPTDENKAVEPRLDLTAEEALALTSFVASLPAPKQVIPSDPAAAGQVSLGAQVFERCRCDACHVSEMDWLTGIYSDLALHDMGEDLCDEMTAMPELQPGEVLPAGFGSVANAYYFTGKITAANPNIKPPSVIPSNTDCEWRTPPLWGCADSAPYLHDGRAATLDEAIRWHGGEAQTSLRAYQALPPPEQQALLAFLNTLRAPSEAAQRTSGGALAAASPSGGSSAPIALAGEAGDPAGVARPADPAQGGAPAPAAAPEAGLAAGEAAPPADPAAAAEPLPALEAAPADTHFPVLQPTIVSQTVYARLNELLADLKPSASRLGRARSLCDQLESELPHSGAADFALALFQKQSLQHRDAVETLKQVSRLTGPYAGRARQALIFEDVRGRDYGSAIAALEQHASIVGRETSLTARDAAEMAEWTGVVIAWLRGPSGIDPSRFDPTGKLDRIRVEFPKALRPYFDAGVTRVETQHAALQAERTALLGLAAEQQQLEQVSLTQKQEELTEQRTELEQSTARERERLDAELAKIDPQLAELEKQYAEREAIEQRLTAQVQPLELRVAGLVLQSNANPRMAGMVSGELQSLSSQVNLINRQRAENQSQARILAIKAQQLIQSRNATVAAYTRKTGQAAQQLESIDKWQSRFEKQADKLEETPAERTRRVQRLDREIRDLATYERFDAREEAQRMLARYRPEE